MGRVKQREVSEYGDKENRVREKADPKEGGIKSHRGAYYHKGNFHNKCRE